MAEDEDKSKIPNIVTDAGDKECGNLNYQYQGPGFDYMTYQNYYSNAYGNYFGGYGPNYGFIQNFPPYPGFYGFPPFQHPPGPLQGPEVPQDTPDAASNVSIEEVAPNDPPVKRKPKDEKIIKAMMRCGIPREDLKDLPRNLLKRYQPDYCGLCSQSLETYALSRLHYICKNHLKKQKKWLSQQSNSGYRRNKEQPLKARELYCEICDVHITSTVHSESHYAGKPHRAIVTGRKNPKNPFLMQRGMEERLEQLIRREKKHLRLGDEDTSDETEVKAIQSELCCEVCHTSVTCTEQMIMHLNGRRHLAKEKRHILRMMKGDGVLVGYQSKCFIAEQGKESARKLEQERLDFENRPDTWDQLRNNNSMTSA